MNRLFRPHFGQLTLSSLNMFGIVDSLEFILGKCHFLPGGGLPKIGGHQVLFLRSKGGSKDFLKLKRGDHLHFCKALQNVDVKAYLSGLHNKYVFVPADKAPNNIIIICKKYYIETLIKELGLDNCSTLTGNSTYTSCQISSEDIVNTHDTFMKSLGIELSEEDKRLPYLHWIPSCINLQ